MNDQLELLLAMAGYMLIVILIGIFFAKKSQANSDNYFLGGRSLGPWVAAMSAEGTSTIQNIEQIDRGYKDIDGRLNALGARITRVEE